MSCGARLGDGVDAPEQSRKIVTVLFCDIVGSTALGERLDPESVRGVMTTFYERMRSVLERHGGTVEKYIGDAVMAVFGVPVLHEDDAIRAVRAAAEMLDVLGSLNVELEAAFGIDLRTRIGINTGQVVVGDRRGDVLLLGDTVNVAARLESAASPGEILLGHDTYVLVRSLVTVDEGQALALKGKADPVTGYRVIDVPPAAERIDRPGPTFVGRAEELETIRATFGRIVEERSCALLTILGAAGVGKTRLADEFAGALSDDAYVAQGRCLAYGEGITFWAVVEMIKELCDIRGDDTDKDVRSKIDGVLAGARDAEAIAEGVWAMCSSGATSGGIQATFWAIRRFLEELASARPVVAVFDDIQWAEPTLLDLIEYLVGRCRHARILILCMARPELLELRPGWVNTEPGTKVMPLLPLERREAVELISNLLGSSPMELGDSARIVEAAEGNPLFVEEMLLMLEDDGLLRRAGDRWQVTGDLSQVAVPPTIQALLAARLDRLGMPERAVLGAASVIGKDFWWGAVSALCAEDLRPSVGTHLQTLIRRGLITPERSTLAGEDAFRFHHLLIQDASYEGLPKGRRADLHERFAGWVRGRMADRAVDYEEVIGYHLEQAWRYRAELGAGPDATAALGAEAAGHLASAGRRALARGDMAAAVSLLERAATCAAADDDTHAGLLPDLSEALMQTGDLSRADDLLNDAIAHAERTEDSGLRGHAMIVRLLLMESTDPKGRSEIAELELERVIPVFAALGDDLGLARAWRLKADVFWTRACYGEADSAIERSIEHARRAGAGWEEAESVGLHLGSGLYGPAPVPDVVERCEQALAGATGNRLIEAQALRSLAALRAMQSRFDEARELFGRAQDILQDLGLWVIAAFTSETAGFIERLAGNVDASVDALRTGFDLIEKLGEQGYLSTVAVLLAHGVLDQRLGDEADRLIGVSAAAAAEDDRSTQVLLESAKGRSLALRGDLEGAEQHCRAAAALAEETDDVNMRGDVWMDLAEVLSDRGDGAGAAEAMGRALALFDAKGNLAQAQAVRRRIDPTDRALDT